MSIKDLFNQEVSQKVLSSVSIDDIGREVESANLVENELKLREKIIPQIDYSNPANFCKFGSAEQYYTDSFNYIVEQYPYDGSFAEKVGWEISASYLDKYIFENAYPRTNGYINLGKNYGTLSSASSNGYSLFDGGSYIFLKGGPHSASQGMIGTPLYETFKDANIYNTGSRQQSNLEIDGTKGITIEFWLKKPPFVSGSESPRQVIFDLWNSASHGSADYGRFRLEIHPGDTAEQRQFYVELMSGTSGLTSGQSFNYVPAGNGLEITGSVWHHYSLSVINSGSSMLLQMYSSGTLNHSFVTGSSIGLITGSMIATIGSLINNVSGTAGGGRGFAKLSGSLDEFRFWKNRRTAEQIGRNWFTQAGGGTNTDLANTQLGVYYKFNEGIVGSGSTINITDTNVLDYSGRVSNGTFIGYVSGSRNTGSAIVESGASMLEFKDPILYQQHADVSASLDTHKLLGYFYDISNNSGLYNYFPEWIVSEDRDKEHYELKKMTQVMASYLDNLYLQIELLPKIKAVAYASGSSKPFPFVSRFLQSAGLIVTDILNNAESSEIIANRDEYRNFSNNLTDTKNKIYQNIYNNLVNIYKAKGTEKSFRNLVRCFGIDDPLIKINLYGDNVTHKLDDNRRYVSVRKKYADFNNTDRFTSTVYQHTSSHVSSRSYISAPANAIYQGQTYECEAIFPKKFEIDSSLFFDTPFVTSSIYGSHTADCLEKVDKTWISPDQSNFQVYATKTQLESPDVFFTLSGTAGYVLPVLTSSIFKDAYDNERWLFAVRIKPTTHPWTNGASGSAENNFVVSFSGYNTSMDIIKNSFDVSGTISHANGVNFMSDPKRFFVGSHRTNFTGSVLNYCDLKISNLRVWAKYLKDEEIISHAKDASNYGTEHPLRPAYVTENSRSFGI